MRRIAIRLAAIMAACLPAAGGAQPFGTTPQTWQVDPLRGRDPVNVEIVEQGRTIWQGSLPAGLVGGPGIELYAQSRALYSCFSRQVGPVVSGDDMDRLALTLQWTDTPFVKDRYAVRLERQRILAVPAVPGEFGWECRDERHHGEDLTVTASPRLPPGHRVRVDGAGGLEIFLTRPADAVTPEPVSGGDVTPTLVPADFDVTIERAGAVVWTGTFHQEIAPDRSRAQGSQAMPRTMPCPARVSVTRCAAWARENWSLDVRASNEREVTVEFSAGHNEPAYMVSRYGGIMDRGEGAGMQVSATLALAEGETGLVRAQDYVVRLRRR
jgi:hypothetical protein